MNSFAYLKELSDDELTKTLSGAVQSETKASLFVLHVLAEFESRRLYSKNASSLHHYCTKVLKFSGGAAQRRIDSMRAMKLFLKSKKN